MLVGVVWPPEVKTNEIQRARILVSIWRSVSVDDWDPRLFDEDKQFVVLFDTTKLEDRSNVLLHLWLPIGGQQPDLDARYRDDGLVLLLLLDLESLVFRTALFFQSQRLRLEKEYLSLVEAHGLNSSILSRLVTEGGELSSILGRSAGWKL